MIRILLAILILCVIYSIIKGHDEIFTPVKEGVILFIKIIQLVLTAILKLVQAFINVLS